jgi:hypothetical protein
MPTNSARALAAAAAATTNLCDLQGVEDAPARLHQGLLSQLEVRRVRVLHGCVLLAYGVTVLQAGSHQTEVSCELIGTLTQERVSNKEAGLGAGVLHMLPVWLVLPPRAPRYCML